MTMADRYGLPPPKERFMGDVGIMGLHVPGMSWREIRESAVLAEELGYSCLTMGESWGEDAFTSLAQLAAVTSRIRVGTSIVPVFARSPANLAMTAATTGSTKCPIEERQAAQLPVTTLSTR